MSDKYFIEFAAKMLNVSTMQIEEAMQLVRIDMMNGVDEYTPFVLGTGVFCGPTTEYRIKSTEPLDVLTNGTCWAAAVRPSIDPVEFWPSGRGSTQYDDTPPLVTNYASTRFGGTGDL